MGPDLVALSYAPLSARIGGRMSPWDILGWMLVGVVGMVIAVFLIGILAFVLVSLVEARQKRRWRKQARQRSADMIRNARKIREAQEMIDNARGQ